MITKVIKLSDLPVLSKNRKDIGDSKLIAVINDRSYTISLKQIKQNNIESIVSQLSNYENGVFNKIEIYWDDGNKTRLLVKNGSDGDPGYKGQTGEKGQVGESVIGSINTNTYRVLEIVNNNETDDIHKVWSAYCGNKVHEFLKSISEIFLDEYTYDIMNEEEMAQYINLEFNSSSNKSQIVNNNNNHGIILYKKYWTYEDEGTIEYFIVSNDEINGDPSYRFFIGNEEVDYETYIESDDPNKTKTVDKYYISTNTVYQYFVYDTDGYKKVTYNEYVNTAENQLYPKYITSEYKEFDLINEYYLDPNNDNTYATRRLVTENDSFTGEITEMYYIYTEVPKPVWLELEFTTDEDTTSIVLNNDYRTEDDTEEHPNESKEDEIIIINKPIESITLDNYDITIPMNSIVTIPVYIHPIDYTDNVYINYDENVIKVFEDGRIMAIKENVEETIIKIYSTDDENIPNKYPQKYVELRVHVITYVNSLSFKDIAGNYITSINGFKSLSSKKSVYDIIPEITPATSTNKQLEWTIDDIDFARFVDNSGINVIGTNTIHYYLYNLERKIYEECTIDEYNSFEIPEVNDDETENIIYQKTKTSSTIVTDNDNPIKVELINEGKTTIDVLVKGGSKPIIYTMNINIDTGINDIIVPESIKLLLNIPYTIESEIVPENATYKKLIWYKDTNDPNNQYMNVSKDSIDDTICRVNVGRINAESGKLYVKSDDGYNDELIKEIPYIIEIPVTSITLTQNNLPINTSSVISLDKNDEITIVASVNDSATNKALEWTSSNTSIFDVEDLGNNRVKIKAINGGDATITVSATDGSGFSTTINMKCIVLTENIEIRNNISHIYVDNNYNIVYSEDLNQDNMILYKKVNGNSEIKFFTSNNNIASVSGTTLSIHQPGDFKLYAKAMDNAGYITNINIKAYRSGDGLLLEESEATITVNDTYIIIAAVYPDDTTYQKILFKEIIEEGAESIIDIDEENGVINPKSTGVANIEVSTISKNEDGKLSQIFTLTITD